MDAETRDTIEAIRKERAAGGPICESATWKTLLEHEIRPDFSELYKPFLQALTAADVDQLVELCLGDVEEPDLSLALTLVGSLVGDERLAPESTRVWADHIGQKLKNKDDGPWLGFLDVWVDLDRGAAEKLLVKRQAEDDDLDERLFLSLRRKEKLLSRDDRKRWIDRVEEIAKRDLEVGRSAYILLPAWLELSPDTSREFLCENFDLERTRPANRRVYIDTLTALGTAEAVARLRQIGALGNRESELARKSLRMLGEDSQEPIENLAAEWRASRDGSVLTRLYDDYINRLPVGTAFGPWLERLGEPSQGSMSQRELYYTAAGGAPTLYVELDDDGKIWGRKLE